MRLSLTTEFPSSKKYMRSISSSDKKEGGSWKEKYGVLALSGKQGSEKTYD